MTGIVCLSVCMYVCLSVCLSDCLSVCVCVASVENSEQIAASVTNLVYLEAS